MISPTLVTAPKDQSNQIMAEMIRNQLDNIALDRKLLQSDMQRMVRYLNASIFHSGACSLWQGYVTDRTGKNKGSYINFFFHGKKFALHRLLYINFLGPLEDDEYVKFRCQHKGYCCSVHCLEKQKYRRLTTKTKQVSNNFVSVPTFIPSVPLSDDRLNIFFV